jgi:hypothetical protein
MKGPVEELAVGLIVQGALREQPWQLLERGREEGKGEGG